MSKITTALVLVFSLFPTLALSKDWSFEFTPYAWLAGIDADVAAGDREGDVDISFSDLLDNLDLAAAFIARAQYDRWVIWGQVDYLDLDTGEVDTDFDVDVRLDTTAFFLTTAAGYQFDGFFEHSTIDVLFGVRYLKLRNTLSVEGFGDGRGSNELLDGVVIIRPSFPLGQRWRFNPTLSIGRGDSDLTYELQPQFQYQFNETLLARVGYRKLYYDVDKNDLEFDGDFNGFLFGLGFTF